MTTYFCECPDEGAVGMGATLTEAYENCMDNGGYSKINNCRFFKGDVVKIEIKEVAVAKIVEKKTTTMRVVK